jgi:hypothetical protein
MHKWIAHLVCFVCLLLSSLITPSVLADEPEYQQHQLPDGSTETETKQPDGSDVKQIQHPDGTVDTDIIDSQGDETITTQHPDGTVDVKNKAKN